MNDPNDSALVKWAEGLAIYASGPPEIQGTTVSIRSSRGDVHVPPLAPPGTRLDVWAVGRNNATFALITPRENPPPWISLHGDRQLRQLDLRSLRGTPRLHLEIDLAQCNEPVAVRGTLPAGLSILDGSVALNDTTRSGPTNAILRDAYLDFVVGGDWQLNRLAVSGDVDLRGLSLRSSRTSVSEAVRFHRSNDLDLGDVEEVEGGPIQITTLVPVKATSLPDGAGIELGNTIFSLGSPGYNAAPITGLRVSGSGSIVISSSVADALFSRQPGQPPLTVVLAEGSQLLDARSAPYSEPIALQLAAGSVCTGHPELPLRLQTVQVHAGSQLQDVNCYELKLPDLLQVQECQRFHPWIPRPRRSWRPVTWVQHPARHWEDAQIDELTRDLSLRERSHYWATMATILKESHAPGWVQSEARYAAARCRRASTPDRREWLLLSVYRLAGYGERIFRPVLLLGALAAIAVALHSGANGLSFSPEAMGSTVRLWFRYLVAPLAFFRIESLPSIHVNTFWPGLGLTVYRAVGILLIVICLIATRRIAKAE
jgi:hypothetical protein